MEIAYRAVGRIVSPFKTPAGAPIQPAAARGVEGRVEFAPEFAPGLRDLDGFSHVIVLWHMHLCEGYSLDVVPFLDVATHGIFATRSPRRPNPIGLSVYRLLAVEPSALVIGDVDALDGSPVIDVKPFVPAFDAPAPARIGWLAGRLDGVENARGDDRFT